MARGSGIHSSRIGAGPRGDNERGDFVARAPAAFWCANGHVTRPSFAVSAVVPEIWDRQDCGLPAGRDRDNPPTAALVVPFKTHLAYVRKRRREADGEILLVEALSKLRVLRGEERVSHKAGDQPLVRAGARSDRPSPIRGSSDAGVDRNPSER